MRYYRRKPLDASGNADEATSPGNAAESTALRQPPSSASAPPLGPPTLPEPGAAAPQTVEAAALVHKAASILEEEMAAGMLAAQDARRSTFGSAARSVGGAPGAQDHMLRTVRDFVDVFAELVTRIHEPLSQWPGAAAVRGGYTGQTAPEAEHEQVPVLRARESAQAGGHVTIPLKLHNDDTQPARLTLCFTDLFSSIGYRIPEHQVVCTPRAFQLEPDAFADVQFHIGVPHGTPAGTYAGLLMASGLPYLRAVILLTVESV